MTHNTRPDDQTIAAQLRKPTGELGKKVAEKMNESNGFLYEQAFAMMQIAETDHILEIGFGNGAFFKRMQETAKRGFVAGIDFSEEMVSEATANHKSLIMQGKLEVRLGNIEAIPYPDAHFDKVLTLNTIYFWENTQKAIKEIHRVLKPGGMCCIGLRSGTSMKKHSFTKYGFAYFEPAEVVHLLEQNGFGAIRYKHEPDPSITETSFDYVCVTALKL